MAVPKTTETRCRDGSVQARHVIQRLHKEPHPSIFLTLGGAHVLRELQNLSCVCVCVCVCVCASVCLSVCLSRPANLWTGTSRRLTGRELAA